MEKTTLRLGAALAVLVTVLVGTQAAPTQTISGASTALLYLSRFGYMDPAATNPQTGSLLSEAAVRASIIEFQAFAGLNQTGELDENTLEMMNTPRCGVKDKVGYGSNARKKRYALQGSRWRVRDLTYRITKYPRNLFKREVDEVIEKAFNVWAGVTSLTFKAVRSGKVHIEVRFEKGEHGDGDPFDGPGGTLAHAYFPIYGGDAHFDDSETWTIKSYRGTNLFQVAAHEFGHSLGLSHSDVQSALMAPFYRGYESTFNLDQDDITAIQSLYGTKTTKATPAPEPSTSRPKIPSGSNAQLCKDGNIDAIVTMSDRKTYVFKGSQYWQLTDDGVAQGYPKSIASGWGNLVSNLDAAFTWTNGKTYFFKGDKYWRFTDLRMDKGYPKLISQGFAGIPDNVDAAFVWSGNGKIYFFKGSKYYRFDPTQRPPVKESYPKPVKNWEGLPDNIDDALQYDNGYTYFFKDGNYWRFNDRAFRVDQADPKFPRPTGYWWFGCPATSSLKSHSLQSGRADILPVPGAEDVEGDSFDADGSDGSSSSSYKEGLSPRTAENRSSSATVSANYVLALLVPVIAYLLKTN